MIENVIDLSQVNMQGLDTAYANSNKWIAYFPLEDNLGKDYKNLELHLTRFSLPLIAMASTTVSFRGYQKEIPTKVMNPDTKELTLEYIVDAEWKNYKSLYKWMSGITGTLNPSIKTSDINGINPSEYVPLRIYLLNPYKKKLILFYYQNAWIKYFNELSLEAGNPNEVTHSFTVVYDSFLIEEI